MEPLLTSEEMRAADARTIKELKISQEKLIDYASDAVILALKKRFQIVLPQTKGLIVYGKGNNGKDAQLVSMKLSKDKIENIAVLPDKIPSDLEKYDWIIDGIFGTGLSRAVSGKELSAIKTINKYSGKKWIISIDIPSGLNADTGVPMPVAVEASETVCLGFYKRGLVTGKAKDYVGKLSLNTIQMPRDLAEKSLVLLFTSHDVKSSSMIRKATSNKGDFGHVYILAGESEKEGASLLASLGAFRSGVGKVTVLGKPEIRKRLPFECMVMPLEKFKPTKDSVVVIGPGMGTGKKQEEILEKFLKSDVKLILDADALTLLSKRKKRVERKALTVYSPHPKEAARLLNSSVEEIEKDRYQAVEALSEKYPGITLLKGAGTLIKETKGNTIVVNQGDSGLAKGGTGDVLSGILGSFIAQGIDSVHAVALAAYSHGRASEILSQRLGTERSSLASEIANELPSVFRELGR